MARARVISALALLFVLAIATVVAADESCDATRGSCAADAAPEESPADVAKLRGLPLVLWLNLDADADRRGHMERMFDRWNVTNHVRVRGHDARRVDVTTLLHGGAAAHPGEIGCTVSHLKALRYFVTRTDEDVALIMEDDADIEQASHWSFAWEEFFDALPVDYDTVQLSLINTQRVHVSLHPRFSNDYGAAAYLVTRHHATKLLRQHVVSDDAVDSDDGVKYRLDNSATGIATSEEILFHAGRGYAVAVFNYRYRGMRTTIHQHEGESLERDHDLIQQRSSKPVREFWEQHGSTTTLSVLMRFVSLGFNRPPLYDAQGRIPPISGYDSPEPHRFDAHLGSFPTRERDDENDLDVMVGYAAGYEPRELYRLAAAFEDATAANENARLVLFATCDVKDGVRLMDTHPKLRLVRPEDARIPPSTPREIAGNAALVRYVVVRVWLREQLARDPRRIRKMMITDTRDVALFGDPFEQIDASNAHVAQLFTEAATFAEERTRADLPMYNNRWVEGCYGREFLDSISREPIVCSGVVAGGSSAMDRYLGAFIDEMTRRVPCLSNGEDQGLLAWIIRRVLRPNEDVVVMNHSTALVAHAPRFGADADAAYDILNDPSARFDASGRLLNALGVPYAMIHQLDRFPSLWKRYCDRYEDPAWAEKNG